MKKCYMKYYLKKKNINTYNMNNNIENIASPA